MRGFLLGVALCAGLTASWPMSGHAQVTYPAGEFCLGGWKLWAHSDTTEYQNHGLQGSITGNLNRFVGIEMELGGGTNYPKNPPAYGNRYTFLFGPRFMYRGNPRLNPFAHVLLGGTHGRQVAPFFHTTGRTALTAALGGGLDVKVVRFLWIRVIQVDYLRESFAGDPQDNLRLSYGVVFRFGSAVKPVRP